MAALSEKALEGRVVVVTGAARGIGAGIAEAALAARARASALIDRDEAAARETARRLDSSGKRALAVGADVTDPASLRRGRGGCGAARRASTAG